MIIVIALLREMRVRIVVYIDDMLIILAETKEMSHEALEALLEWEEVSAGTKACNRVSGADNQYHVDSL